MALQIKNIDRIGNNWLYVQFTNKESAMLYGFGSKGDIYTEVSENLNKASLAELKKDVIKFEWDIEKLKSKYL